MITTEELQNKIVDLQNQINKLNQNILTLFTSNDICYKCNSIATIATIKTGFYIEHKWYCMSCKKFWDKI